MNHCQPAAISADLSAVFGALSIKAMSLYEFHCRVDLGNREDVPLVHAARDLAGRVGLVVDSAAQAAGAMPMEAHWAGWLLGGGAADSIGRLELGEG